MVEKVKSDESETENKKTENPVNGQDLNQISNIMFNLGEFEDASGQWEQFRDTLGENKDVAAALKILDGYYTTRDARQEECERNLEGPKTSIWARAKKFDTSSASVKEESNSKLPKDDNYDNVTTLTSG